MAPKTIIRGGGTLDSTSTFSGSPQSLPSAPISSTPVLPAVEHGAGFFGDGAVQLGVSAEAALVGAVGTDEDGAAHELGRALGYPGHGRGLTAGRGGQAGREHLPYGRAHRDRGDEDVDDSAAGQTHGEGIVVAVPEALLDGFAVLQRLPATARTPHPPRIRRKPSRWPCPRCRRRERPRAAGARCRRPPRPWRRRSHVPARPTGSALRRCPAWGPPRRGSSSSIRYVERAVFRTDQVGPGQPTPSQPSIGWSAKKTRKIPVSAHMKPPISRALP